MCKHSTVAISIEQLLNLRLLPVPAAHNRPVSNSRWLGAFPSAKRGHGTDYEDLRRYTSGDDVRHIDWRVSARTQELHTRLFREEKEHRSSIICDLRPCMFTGSQQLRANRAVILCARILWLACLAGTRVNLVLVTSTGARLMQSGTGHSAAIRGCALLADEHSRAIAQLSETTTQSANGVPFRQSKNTDETRDTLQATAMPVKISCDQALPVEHAEHGPTLDTVLQWVLQQHELKVSTLWISALDYPGEQFFNTVSSNATSGRTLFIYIDEPVLHNGLPGGVYHYTSHSNDGTSQLSTRKRVRMDRNTQRYLLQQLAKLRQERDDMLSSLKIPCISTFNGDDEVIASLRHQAWIP